MLCSLALVSSLLGFAAASPASPASPFESHLLPRASCSGNTASTRSEWCDYSIDTDYYETVPETNVTREYWVRLSNSHIASHLCLARGRPLSDSAMTARVDGRDRLSRWLLQERHGHQRVYTRPYSLCRLG